MNVRGLACECACVCMYDCDISASIKTLAPFESARAYVSACVCACMLFL